MKYASLAAVALLAACSGGTGGVMPGPHPTPTPAHSVGFSAVSLGSSHTAASVTRRDATCSASSNEIAIMALPASAPPAGSNYNYQVGYDITAIEYLAGCTTEPGQATYTLSNVTTVSQNAPAWTPNVSQAPSGSINVTGVSAGSATLTAKFPDSSTASLLIGVYGTMGVSCASNQYFVYTSANDYAGAGWSQANGAIAQEVGSCGVISMTPAPPPADMQVGANRDIVFPNGYQVVTGNASGSAGTPQLLVGIANCASFSSQGTSLDAATLQTPGIVVLFKTASGACVKFTPEQNEQFLDQNGNATLVGFYALSDASGNFAY